LMGFALWRMLRDSSVQMDRAEIEQTRCEKRNLTDLAPERMPSDISGQACCDEVEQPETLLDAWKSARKLHKPSLFDVLAVEILYAVFNLLALFSPREAIRQAAVCHRWRKIMWHAQPVERAPSPTGNAAKEGRYLVAPFRKRFKIAQHPVWVCIRCPSSSPALFS